MVYFLSLFLVLLSCTSVDASAQSAVFQKKLKLKVDSAKAYIESKGMNAEFCFLVDMSVHSGRNRFFVWDFKRDTVVYSGLCAHGYGLSSTETRPVFSNVEGSYCTSLGKYKTGIRSYSKWGIHIHYKLHGLEKTNNKAFVRTVVLHSYDPVEESEVYPDHLPLGWSQGCPVISNKVMRKIDDLLKNRSKSTLLWIYN